MTVIITVLCIMIIGLLNNLFVKVMKRLDEIEKQIKQYEHDDGR